MLSNKLQKTYKSTSTDVTSLSILKNTLAWKTMINFVAKIEMDVFHGQGSNALQTNFLHDKVQNFIIDLEPLKQLWKKYG
jgi:hypothetical protein